jgi:hypothetical protein
MYDPGNWEYRLREAAAYLDLSPAKIDEIKEKVK